MSLSLSVKPASPYSTPQSLSTNAESLLETTSRSPSRNGRSQKGTSWFQFCRQENEKGLLEKAYGTFHSTSGIQQSR